MLTIEKIEEALNRKLTADERSVVEWLNGWETHTVQTVNGLFEAFYKAGQESQID